MYDPEYDRYSLGFYTMLLEIEYCMELGLKFYYPGYVVPGYSRFDYKLRIGDVDYFDLYSKEWLPFSALQCRLDCNPGYVAHKAPIITCVNGQYQPQARL